MGVKRQQIYVCQLCGSVVEIQTAGVVPSCCGKPMELQAENTVDASKEKHVPVVEAKGSGTLVKVGSVAHPMTEEHHIVWIEIINGDYVNRFYLKPGAAPEAEFYVSLKPGMVVREYCNLHGLWAKVID
ncbi:MAG: desulfoferrodoxin [Lentisphaeria bacterium]|jgi:superoxide reductase|nr:desulfoferrodoxin [Lentisphaeria bacterium]